MATAHLSEADYAAIGAAYTAYISAHHTFSVDDAAWPEVLGPELFDKALEGGYFPPGAYPGLQRDNTKIKGAQVQISQHDDGTADLVLFVDGVEVAREPATAGADTVAFAKRHGQAI